MALVCVWAALMLLTFREWSEMAWQWWNSDSYAHILLIPPIIAWLAWMRRDDLTTIAPRCWWPGLGLLTGALLLWLAGRVSGINLLAHAGAVAAFAAIVPTLLGPRAAALLALPLGFAVFLVPFGEEIVWPMQIVTARLVIQLTHLSGVDAALSGIYITTPVGLFIVAEACSGVKFLIAMIALGVLAAFTGFASWLRRILFLLACVIVPILANAVRAWGTIYLAQFIGAERAGGIDHLIYGWVFFAVVVAIVLGLAWCWFERTPEDTGWSLAELDRSALLAQMETFDGRLPILAGSAIAIAALAAVSAIGFATANG
ncbi:MAG: exosortase [Erythrobacter sp.]|nr:exosortase [Erythrobacter sp.]